MSTPFVHVTAAWTVDQVICCYPAAAPILDGLGLDRHVRPQCTVREAAARAHADLRVVLSRLEDTACAYDDVRMY
jgi:hypothetical protein